MKKITIEDAASRIADYGRILVVAHQKPDGDALGASFALGRSINENDGRADIVLEETPPKEYQTFSPNCILTPQQVDIHRYDVCFCLDTSRRDRAGFSLLAENSNFPIPVLNIDHHPDNDLFGDEQLIVPTAAATASIVFSILKTIPDWSISKEVATTLMLGVIMDTGCFRFDNTSPRVFQEAAELLSLGADYRRIINAMYFSRSLDLIKFEADLMMNELKMEFDNRFAWLCFTPELLQKYGLEIKNTDGVIDAVRSIAGTEVVALLYPRDDGFKISLRSKNPAMSVGEIARKLGGGGHEMAAGGFIKTKELSEAESLLIKEVATLFESDQA